MMSEYRRIAVYLTLALGALLASSAPAAASEQTVIEPAPFSPFGSFSFPTSVAVDQASGEVFISDGRPANVVDIFSAQGSLLGSLSGTGSESFDFAHEAAGLAIDDNPASPSYRDLYVSDVKHNVVDKFQRTGQASYTFLCQFNGWYGAGGEACHTSGGAPVETFEEPLGVTVDAQGDVYIASYGPEEGAVDEFDANGRGILQLPETEHHLLEGHPKYVAVDSTGDIFVLDYNGGAVVELNRGGLTTAATGEHEVPGRGNAIAVDPTNDELYVDIGSEIVRYARTASGELLKEGAFGDGILVESEGLAVAGATHTIYVSNGGPLDADVFTPKTVILPNVEGGCKASALTMTSARLTGEVNPLELPGASYAIAYGLNPYEQQAGGPVEGKAPTSVTAEIGGLEPGGIYHCRISATDTEGEALGVATDGPDSTFETKPLLPTVEEAAPPVEVAGESGVFRGGVNPGNGPTTYHFAYGTEPGNYSSVLPDVALSKGTEPVPVEQAAPPGAFKAGVTYYFELVASNASGTTAGDQHEFVTSPSTIIPPTPPRVIAESAEGVAQNSATLAGTLASEHLPTSYKFEIGTTPAYGTILFGGQLNIEQDEQAVTQAVGGLQPGVTYHYRLVATNAADTTGGPDQTFTTPGLASTIAQPSSLPILPTPVFPIVKYPVVKKHGKPKKHGRSKKHSRAKAHAKRAATKHPRK
jgi:hypothetical protein